MIKLFSLKQQKKDGTDTTARTGQKKATAAQLRITKGMIILKCSAVGRGLGEGGTTTVEEHHYTGTTTAGIIRQQRRQDNSNSNQFGHPLTTTH